MNAGPHLEFVGSVTEAFAFLTDRGFLASVSEVIRATDSIKAQRYRSWCATSPEGIDAGLHSLARLLIEFGGPALAGDAKFLAVLRRQRTEWSQAQVRDTRTTRDRVKLRTAGRRASLRIARDTTSVRLGEQWATVLLREPETGMGYQVATIKLKDGRCFENVTIAGGAISGLPPQVAEHLTDADVASITVTHGRRTRD